MIYGNIMKSTKNSDDLNFYIETVDIINKTDILFSEFSTFLSEDTSFDITPVMKPYQFRREDIPTNSDKNSDKGTIKKIINKIKEFVKKVFDKLKEFLKKISVYMKNFNSSLYGFLGKLMDFLGALSIDQKYYNGKVFEYESYFDQINDTFIDIRKFDDMRSLYNKLNDRLSDIYYNNYIIYGANFTKIDINSNIIADKISDVRKQVLEDSENLGLDILKKSVNTKNGKLRSKIDKQETFQDFKKAVEEYINSSTTEQFDVSKIGYLHEMSNKINHLDYMGSPKSYLNIFGKTGTIVDIVTDLQEDIDRMEDKCDRIITRYENDPNIAQEATKLSTAFSFVIKNYLEYCVWLDKIRATMLKNACKTLNFVTKTAFNEPKRSSKR